MNTGTPGRKSAGNQILNRGDIVKKTFLSVLTFLVLAASAGAASSPFQGMYMGLTGGYARNSVAFTDRDAWVDNFGTDWALGTVTADASAPSGGVYLGYNWQNGANVLGIETDLDMSGLTETAHYTASPTQDTLFSRRSSMKAFGTLRLRAGLTADDAMIYVTGGLAHAKIKHSWLIDDDGEGIFGFESESGRQWAPVAGFGFEWAWSPNVHLKVETLSANFGIRTSTGVDNGDGQIVTFDTSSKLWTARLGVSIKLGS